jgi:hypothetical protein
MARVTQIKRVCGDGRKALVLFCAWRGGDGGFQICGLALECLGVDGRWVWVAEGDGCGRLMLLGVLFASLALAG